MGAVATGRTIRAEDRAERVAWAGVSAASAFSLTCYQNRRFHTGSTIESIFGRDSTIFDSIDGCRYEQEVSRARMSDRTRSVSWLIGLVALFMAVPIGLYFDSPALYAIGTVGTLVLAVAAVIMAVFRRSPDHKGPRAR